MRHLDRVREVATPAAGEQRLSDIILAEIGAVMGRYPASVLISTDPAKSNYQPMASEVVRRVADLARTAYVPRPPRSEDRT